MKERAYGELNGRLLNVEQPRGHNNIPRKRARVREDGVQISGGLNVYNFQPFKIIYLYQEVRLATDSSTILRGRGKVFRVAPRWASLPEKTSGACGKHCHTAWYPGQLICQSRKVERINNGHLIVDRLATVLQGYFESPFQRAFVLVHFQTR